MGFQPAQMQESVLGKYLMQIAENRNRNNAQNQDYAFQREQTKKGQEFTTGERKAGETFTGGENVKQIAANKALTDARIGWERDSDNPQQQELEMKKDALQAETDAGAFLAELPGLLDGISFKDPMWEDNEVDISEIFGLGDLSDEAKTSLLGNLKFSEMSKNYNKEFIKSKTDELGKEHRKVVGAMGTKWKGDDETEMLSAINAIVAGRLSDLNIPLDEYGLYDAKIPSGVSPEWSTEASNWWTSTMSNGKIPFSRKNFDEEKRNLEEKKNLDALYKKYNITNNQDQIIKTYLENRARSDR